MSFEAVLEKLKSELHKEGFELSAVTVYHQTTNVAGGTVDKYQIFHVHDLFLYNEMMRIAPFEGIILPCVISVIETHPGEVALIPYNAIESIVEKIQNPSLQNLAAEVTRRLNLVIHAIETEQTHFPDLVTSWG